MDMKNFKIVNCMGRVINIVLNDFNGAHIFGIEPSEFTPKCTCTGTPRTIHNSISNTIKYNDVIGLPDKVDGTFLIVPRIVAIASKRDDLLVPIIVRNKMTGKIVGYRLERV